jgi:succinate-semialdehyde dehydrogenase/glutarate-semialdehyde dehydrogenase
VLELGGKDPMIVFEDANLDLAARAAVWGAFCNSGQSCSSVERLYVHESVADELTRKIIDETKKLKQGVGDAEDISIGAMSSERQLKIVEEHVEDFRAAGAKIETGGRRNADALVRNEAEGRTSLQARNDQHSAENLRDEASLSADEGVRVPLFYEPTVITGATNDMRAMREETFGPTLPIATFSTEAEAIRLANDSEFGLTASVWTRDKARGKRVAEQIEAGSVCVNEVLYTHGIGQTPWGGFKNSGRGRTHGREGLMEMVQAQHIHVNHLAILPNAWWMPYSATAVATFRKMGHTFASGSLLKTTTLMPQVFKRIRELLKK